MGISSGPNAHQFIDREDAELTYLIIAHNRALGKKEYIVVHNKSIF